MIRYRPSSSYGHQITYLGEDTYRLSWTVDFYYQNSRLRWPRTFNRVTDTKGAERFAKKWAATSPSDAAGG